MPADLVLFNQRCLLVHWKSKRKATWPMSLHLTCQLTMCNFISQDCYIVNTTYMPCRELVCSCSCNICLLTYCYCHQHRCCSNIHTCWVLLQDGCLLGCGHSFSMPADLLSLNIACLLVLCFYSIIPADMVSQYQRRLLVWCRMLAWRFIIGHAFWFGTSLSVMHVGVVPHCSSCLLMWLFTIGHACWRGTLL